MSASKQRKIYVAVLGLALGGLAVDRLMLDESATAPREAAAAAGLHAPASRTAAASVPGGAKPRGPTLAARLDQLGRSNQLDPACVSDAFRPSLSWPRPVEPAPAAKPVAPAVDPVQAFIKGHRLMAVVQNTSGGAAIVNGQTLGVGMDIGGFKLTSITRRSATFEGAGGAVELTLASPGKLATGD